MFTKEMINDYADKLLIGLTEEETDTLLNEFDVIKEHMDNLDNIPNLKDVEPMSFPTEYKLSSLREDTGASNLSTKDVLLNAPDKMEDVVTVTKVVTE